MLTPLHLPCLTDPIVERIERRIALATHLPLSHQEDIQVLRYTAGQKYGAHYDSAGNDGQVGPHFRLATFLMWVQFLYADFPSPFCNSFTPDTCSA